MMGHHHFIMVDELMRFNATYATTGMADRFIRIDPIDFSFVHELRALSV